MDTIAQPALARTRRRETLRIAIVGAGFGGIGLAILLKRAGFSALTIFERGAAVGGTWRDNSYPGAACDVQSHLYSYSFAPRPEWSLRYSGQKEILAYIQETASRFGVLPHVALNTAVTGARWDEARGVWEISTGAGGTQEFDVFVPAMGLLSHPVIPRFAGLEDFAGARFHSASWDHSVPLAGKRVALIGSAASAVQILPELQKICAHVDVYQRTPNWIVPRGNGPYGGWRKTLYRHFAPARMALRLYLYLYGEFLFDAFRKGSWRNRMLKNVALKHLAAQVPDAGMRAAMTPQYELGCKRVLFSDDYYPCFSQPNVSLVTSPIAHFEADGIRAADAVLRPAEVAVFATGFDATNCLAPVSIAGRGGLDLQAHWRDGPYAYRGVAVPEFPNMMIIYGPNTNLGHNSIIFMLEQQARYIVRCMEHVVERNVQEFEVSQAACAAWNESVQAKLRDMVWTTGCGSWYETGTRVTANWSGSTLEYRRVMKRPVFADYIERTA